MNEQAPRPDEKTFDPEMTDGDEANAPQGTPAETGAEENLEDLARDRGIPEDPQRPT